MYKEIFKDLAELVQAVEKILTEIEIPKETYPKIRAAVTFAGIGLIQKQCRRIEHNLLNTRKVQHYAEPEIVDAEMSPDAFKEEMIKHRYRNL